MKKLLVVLLSMIVVITASAQHRGGRHFQPRHYYHHYYRPHTRIIVGLGGYYPYYPLSPYNYWGYPPYYSRPSKLDLEIQDIRADYKDKIWSVRHDKNLSRKERKKEIHELKAERDQAIRDAERNYYLSR
jgi:hypothetical protein